MSGKLGLPWVADLPTYLLGEARQRPVLGALATIGTLWAARQAYDLASFTYVHFLHRSTLGRYLGSGSEASWALVTGASDGIGRGFAEELCKRGFNVILHGRNETKLRRVRDELLKQWPRCKLRVLVLDGVADARNSTKLEAAAHSLEEINLRILINNVGGDGGAKTAFSSLQERTSSEVQGFIDVNATFPTEITRVLLPLLVRQKSALMINIGSGASELSVPYLSVYAGAKSYDRAWSRAIEAEMRAEGTKVEVLFILVGMVSTAGTQDRDVSFFVPSARQMAKSSLDAVGCGRSEIWAYLPHALQFGVLTWLPSFFLYDFAVNLGKKMRAEEQERMKKQ